MKLNKTPLCDAHIHPLAANKCDHEEFFLFVNSIYEGDFSRFPSFSSSRYYFAGIHPWHLRKPKYRNTSYYFDLIERAVRRGFFVGETGLDRLHPAYDLQKEYFSHHYALAQTYQRPLTFHSVRSDEDILSILKPPYPGLIYHSFVGNPQSAAPFLSRGVFLSFSPRSLNSSTTLETVKICPLSQLLLESDSLEENPQEILSHSFKVVAALHQIPEEDLRVQVYNNMLGLIRL